MLKYIWAVLLLTFPSTVLAQAVIDTLESKAQGRQLYVVVPYIFSAPTLRFAAGVGAGGRGLLQEQMGLFGTVFASRNGTYTMFLSAEDIRLGRNSRWFLDARGTVGYYGLQRTYVAPANSDGVAVSGGNDSSATDFLGEKGQKTCNTSSEGDGVDNRPFG